MARKYSRGASKKVESAVKREEGGSLRSGPGGKGGRVKSRAQAIAIGLSEARAAGEKVPPNPNRGTKKATKKSAAKTSKKAAKKTTKRAAKKATKKSTKKSSKKTAKK